MREQLPLDEAAALLEGAGMDAAEVAAIAEVAGTDADRLIALARARAEGTPLAYLTGRNQFMGVELLTAPGVLVPRPETELLARTAVEVLQATAACGREVRFLDLCCGAGNLACAIAAHVPAARGWASDLTPEAVALARQNVVHLGLGGRVKVVQGDLLAGLEGLGLEGSLDALVCNPPYISTGRLERDRASLLRYEPREAFDGGPYGLSIHQRVVREAAVFLRPGAPLLFEVGAGQDRQVAMLLRRARAWDEPETRSDAGGVPRVIMARRKAG